MHSEAEETQGVTGDGEQRPASVEQAGLKAGVSRVQDIVGITVGEAEHFLQSQHAV